MKPTDPNLYWWVVGAGNYQQLRTSGGPTQGEIWQAGGATWYGKMKGQETKDAMEFKTEEAAKNWVETTLNLLEE